MDATQQLFMLYLQIAWVDRDMTRDLVQANQSKGGAPLDKVPTPLDP